MLYRDRSALCTHQRRYLNVLTNTRLRQSQDFKQPMNCLKASTLIHASRLSMRSAAASGLSARTGCLLQLTPSTAPNAVAASLCYTVHAAWRDAHRCGQRRAVDLPLGLAEASKRWMKHKFPANRFVEYGAEIRPTMNAGLLYLFSRNDIRKLASEYSLERGTDILPIPRRTVSGSLARLPKRSAWTRGEHELDAAQAR